VTGDGSTKNGNGVRMSDGGVRVTGTGKLPWADVVISVATKKPRWTIIGALSSTLVLFLSGWFARSNTEAQDQLSSSVGIVDVTRLGVNIANVGVLQGVTILGTWNKTPPGGKNQRDMVTIKFPMSDANCGISCSQALKAVMGSNSCFMRECIAELEDVDEGGKVNSSDIFGLCQNYYAAKQKVLIEFTGKRDQSKSQYANILLVLPAA
jgi:hypothetical protein